MARILFPELAAFIKAAQVVQLAAPILRDLATFHTSPAIGDWTLPAAHGWVRVANFPGGNQPDTQRHQIAPTSGAVISLFNSGASGQAVSTPFAMGSSIPSATTSAWWYRLVSGTWGTAGARYACRQAWDRPAGQPVSAAVKEPVSRPYSRPVVGPEYVRVPNVPLDVVSPPSGDLKIDIRPRGRPTVRPALRLKPKRDVRERKRKPWAKIIMGVLMKASDYASEFYEFNDAACDALGYKGPDNQAAKIEWLYWEGNIDRMDMELLYETMKGNEIEDMLYGKWQQSFDKATMERGGFAHNPEIGSALDGWWLNF